MPGLDQADAPGNAAFAPFHAAAFKLNNTDWFLCLEEIDLHQAVAFGRTLPRG